MEVLWTFMVGMITSDKVKKRIPDRFFWQKLRFLVFRLFFSLCINNSDYLQKARKYGHFTGYEN